MPELSNAPAAAGDHRIRVLLTTPLMSRPGGVAQYMRVVRPYLENDVQYFTIGSRSDNEGVNTVLWRMVQDSCEFARTLRHGRYDLVHLNPSIGFKALLRDGVLLVIAKALHKAVVVFAHGWDEAFERLLATRLSRLFRFVYGRADAFIVLGPEFKSKLRSLGYKRTVFVQDAPIEDELLEDCRQQSFPRPPRAIGRKFNILFLARVEKEKGIYEALETYRILKEKYPVVSLIVAGDGSELRGAVRYACSHQLADVSFSGHVEQDAKYEIFRTADAYLLPSYTEGLPISVLEAMAYGLPIVTRAVGGLRGLFQDGTMGFMTESRDPEVLASLLSRLISDPGLCSRISEFNRKYARDQFTGRKVAARLERVYRSLLGDPH